jgi:hypothetical protein
LQDSHHTQFQNGNLEDTADKADIAYADVSNPLPVPNYLIHLPFSGEIDDDPWLSDYIDPVWLTVSSWPTPGASLEPLFQCSSQNASLHTHPSQPKWGRRRKPATSLDEITISLVGGPSNPSGGGYSHPRLFSPAQARLRPDVGNSSVPSQSGGGDSSVPTMQNLERQRPPRPATPAKPGEASFFCLLPESRADTLDDLGTKFSQLKIESSKIGSPELKQES